MAPLRGKIRRITGSFADSIEAKFSFAMKWRERYA
jgi:hypothetical protein